MLCRLISLMSRIIAATQCLGSEVHGAIAGAAVFETNRFPDQFIGSTMWAEFAS
jgi:hypothetical protein